MSSPKKIVLNCGASHLSLASFTEAGGELKVEKLLHASLDYDFSDEAQWLPAVVSALGDLKQYKVAGPVHVILPGFLLVTKTLRIAHVDEGKQRQMIAYEAQQGIPYPLSTVTWGFQVIEDDGIETEVLFIAIRADLGQRICRELASIGFPPVSLSASTILDYNAFQHVYGDPQGSALVLDIGAKASNLTFIDADGFSVRNISHGGNALTQHFSDNLGKGFVEAEHAKIEAIEHEGGGKYAQVLEAGAAAFCRRINQEITRSIVNFRNQRKSPAPSRLLLKGRGALLPGLADALAKQQKTEVSFFDVSTGVDLSPSGIDSKALEAYQMTELVGLAVAGQVNRPVGVELLPPSIRSEMLFRRQKPFYVAAAVLLALSPFPFLLSAKAEAESVEQARQEVRQVLPEREAISREMSATMEAITGVRAQIERFEGLVQSKDNWIRLFSDLQESLHGIRDAWLDRLTVTRERQGNDVVYRLSVGGRLLLRDGNTDQVVTMERINQEQLARRIENLSNGFVASPFIRERSSLRIDFMAVQGGDPLLPFEMEFIIEPERPL